MPPRCDPELERLNRLEERLKETIKRETAKYAHSPSGLSQMRTLWEAEGRDIQRRKRAIIERQGMAMPGTYPGDQEGRLVSKSDARDKQIQYMKDRPPVRPNAPGVDEVSRQLLKEIAMETGKDITQYPLNWSQKNECHRIMGLMERLNEDIKRRSRTLVPGSTGATEMTRLWLAELGMIERHIKHLVREVVESNSGSSAGLRK